MSTRLRLAITLVVALVMAWQIFLLPSFWWWWMLAALLVAAILLYQPAIKRGIVSRAWKLGVPFSYTEGPYVLFRGEKIDLQTASKVLDELLLVMMEYADLSLQTPQIPQGKVKGSLSMLTWRIVLRGDYSIDPAYIQMHRESKRRRDQKYILGA